MRRFNLKSLFAVVALIALGVGVASPMALAQYSTKNYSAQGGDSWVVGSGGTLDVQSGATFNANVCLVSANLQLNTATTTNLIFYVAGRAMSVKAINVRIATANGSAATLTVKKVPSATAVASGVAVHSGTANLNAASDTNQALTILTDGSQNLAAGDSLIATLSAVIGNTIGTVTVCLGAI